MYNMAEYDVKKVIPLIVNLPQRLKRETMYDFISSVIDQDRQPTAREIVLDFSTLEFIEPVGVTVLSNVTEWLLAKDVTVRYKCPDVHSREAMRYLDDSLFFERYLSLKLRPNAKPRETTIPLELVAYSESYRWFNKVLSWLSLKLNVSTSSLSTIKVCFQEIFNNINDHSQEHIGCVTAQHYPRNNAIVVAISDFGVGIPYNIQKMQPSLTDSLSLLKATEEGISTKSTPQNRGAGLDTLIWNVVRNNQGSVYIHSNGGILNCIYDNDRVDKIPLKAPGFYPGTLIEVVFRTDTISNILDSEEAYEW